MGATEELYAWDAMAREDLIGMDRLSRSVLRVVVRMDAGKLIAVHGAPGSGKSEFLRRTAWLAAQDRARGATDGVAGIYPGVVWYRPWAWSKQGNILAGLVAAVARAGVNPESHIDRSRELVAQINRLRFDGSQPETAGAAFSGFESDPVGTLATGFAALVESIKGGRGGRMLVFIDEMDQLSPALRWQMLDGVRIMLRAGANATVFMCMGREAALAAIRFRDGPVPDAHASRDLDELFDLSLTVPNLEVRRISSLLRRFIGGGEAVIRQSFGGDAVMGLSAAVAHRPLGSPRFLERLAHRVILLAEYSQEVRAVRELTEAQWAWVIISERWPEFRRFMIRGGRERWVDLKLSVARMSRRGEEEAPRRSAITDWLVRDPILADYLRLHAEGIDRDAEAIFWLENLLLAAGL